VTSPLKISAAKALHAFALNKVNEVIQLTGKGLPCSVVSVAGAIITVKPELVTTKTIPNLTVPLFGPIYIRYPIQVGDLGVLLPFDLYIGGISGLGGGTAGLDRRGNLSALVFLPIANTDWSAVDPNSVNVNGPNGVVLRDTTSATTFTLTPTTIHIVATTDYKITVGGSTYEMTGAQVTVTTAEFQVNAPVIQLNGAITQGTGSGGAAVSLIGPVTVTNDLRAAGVSMQLHYHGGVTAGGANTAAPVAGS
jgi:hypothetical protein